MYSLINRARLIEAPSCITTFLCCKALSHHVTMQVSRQSRKAVGQVSDGSRGGGRILWASFTEPKDLRTWKWLQGHPLEGKAYSSTVVARVKAGALPVPLVTLLTPLLLVLPTLLRLCVWCCVVYDIPNPFFHKVEKSPQLSDRKIWSKLSFVHSAFESYTILRTLLYSPSNLTNIKLPMRLTLAPSVIIPRIILYVQFSPICSTGVVARSRKPYGIRIILERDEAEGALQSRKFVECTGQACVARSARGGRCITRNVAHNTRRRRVSPLEDPRRAAAPP
ncbi:unnamed protein product, partial [Laminaria digitata]